MIFPFTFTVPSNSQIGPTRIRVVCMGNAGSNTTMGPCESQADSILLGLGRLKIIH